MRSFGLGLTLLFAGAVALWALVLIIAPQLTIAERALTLPARALDSSIAASLGQDARTCISVLNTQARAAATPTPAPSGGMAVPSMGGMAVPSMGGMAVPSARGGTTGRPYILQCDRADTHRAMVRADGSVQHLDALYDLPPLRVQADAPMADQIATSEQIATMAEALAARLRAQEAGSLGLTLDNFRTLVAPVLIPMDAATRARADAEPVNQLYGLIGLRFERDGEVYQRIGLMTLTRTLVFAMIATLIALVLCYPIAYKIALATTPERAAWLFLGLVIPYAIVELMRIYAWTTILDNRGLVNEFLMWTGATSEPIQFKRSPLTVFLVIVYTYVLFMVFPIFNVMSTLDSNQLDAARDLGAGPLRMHWRVVIPHAKPGIAVGCIATFMLAAGAFSVPRIISSGLQAEWFSQTIYNKFFESENSNVGAAYSLAYTLVCFIIVAVLMAALRTRLKDFARVQS